MAEVSSEAKGGLTRFDFSELEGTKARLEAGLLHDGGLAVSRGHRQ